MLFWLSTGSLRMYNLLTGINLFLVFAVLPTVMTLVQVHFAREGDLDTAQRYSRFINLLLRSAPERTSQKLLCASAAIVNEEFDTAREILKEIVKKPKRIPPAQYNAAIFNLTVTFINEEDWRPALYTLKAYKPESEDSVEADLAKILSARAQIGIGDFHAARDLLAAVRNKEIEEYRRVNAFLLMAEDQGAFNESGIDISKLMNFDSPFDGDESTEG
jgi:hypothetical protein